MFLQQIFKFISMKKFLKLFVIGYFISLTSYTQTTNFDLGTKHNQVVDYLNNYDFTGKDENAFMDELIFYTGKLFDVNAFPEGKGGLWGVIQFCGKADVPTDWKTVGEVIDLHTTKGNISTNSSIFLKKLETELDSTTNYEEFSTKIAELESEFNFSILPLMEQTIVKGTFDVFKSSVSYWKTFSDGQTFETRWNWRCILCVAWNDLKGAAIGFLVGNCPCKKLGIPNPAICGAVGAAIYGGLCSWAAKVCPERCPRCYKPPASSYPSWLCNVLLF
jgi:hypothetical protein